MIHMRTHGLGDIKTSYQYVQTYNSPEYIIKVLCIPPLSACALDNRPINRQLLLQ